MWTGSLYFQTLFVAMGQQESKARQADQENAFSAKELYSLKQVYFYLCLHTTTLTSCPLDRNQFQSLFGNHRQYKPLWRALFNAIDLNGDGIIDFDEFLTFVTHLKRGDSEAKRRLCFRLFDPNHDGYAERCDFKAIAQAKSASLRRLSWQPPAQQSESSAEDEFDQFFTACDEKGEGRFTFEDLDAYCIAHGETMINQTIRLLEVMFDSVVEETGIVITATDVKNTKPHIDWQDHKIGMGSLFCCSSAPPVFTTSPMA
eukprot:TRINITY_DN6030_c0_g1_i1.p1 TRINITY_DN6030_c0_g1~~TRINITY_DN6030_c0_g1_i1.p1  ORF type:complete len:259 (-),score=47.51 TRINITY_DN6030_c0_g1_i1:187-963(-)